MIKILLNLHIPRFYPPNEQAQKQYNEFITAAEAKDFISKLNGFDAIKDLITDLVKEK